MKFRKHNELAYHSKAWEWMGRKNRFHGEDNVRATSRKNWDLQVRQGRTFHFLQCHATDSWLQEIVQDRGDWHATVHEVWNWTQLRDWTCHGYRPNFYLCVKANGWSLKSLHFANHQADFAFPRTTLGGTLKTYEHLLIAMSTLHCNYLFACLLYLKTRDIFISHCTNSYTQRAKTNQWTKENLIKTTKGHSCPL